MYIIVFNLYCHNDMLCIYYLPSIFYNMLYLYPYCICYMII